MCSRCSYAEEQWEEVLTRLSEVISEQQAAEDGGAAGATTQTTGSTPAAADPVAVVSMESRAALEAAHQRAGDLVAESEVTCRHHTVQQVVNLPLGAIPAAGPSEEILILWIAHAFWTTAAAAAHDISDVLNLCSKSSRLFFRSLAKPFQAAKAAPRRVVQQARQLEDDLADMRDQKTVLQAEVRLFRLSLSCSFAPLQLLQTVLQILVPHIARNDTAGLLRLNY